MLPESSSWSPCWRREAINCSAEEDWRRPASKIHSLKSCTKPQKAQVLGCLEAHSKSTGNQEIVFNNKKQHQENKTKRIKNTSESHGQRSWITAFPDDFQNVACSCEFDVVGVVCQFRILLFLGMCSWCL